MNKNILIVLAGGFLIAILVAVLVQASLGGKKKEENVPRVQVLVAAKNLSVGREIQDGDLEWQDWPEDAVFAGAIMRDGEQEVLDVAQGKLLRPLVEGQPVHMNVLVEEDRGDFLSANVEKGKRAVGIQVKSYVVADRLIRPGDYVDVIMTYKIKVNTRNNPQAQSLVNKYASETILEKVRVLAIDSEDTKAVDEIEDGKKKKKKKKSKKAIVTLEVTPEGAETLLLGDEMGDIGLALRSIGDEQSPKDDRMTTDVGATKVLTDLAEMNGVSAGVRVYNGSEVVQAQARSSKSASGNIEFGVEDNYSSEEFDLPSITLDPSALLEFLEE